MKPIYMLIVVSIFAFVTLMPGDEPADQSQTRGIVVIAKSGLSAKQEVVKLYNKLYAVVIGIDTYKNLPPNRQLLYAVKDARAVAEVLREKFAFEKVYELYNEEATKAGINALFYDELRKKLTKEDGLLVFWASHGFNDKGIGILIPHDGDPARLYMNISMNEIKTDISSSLPSKHIFFIVDACYGGILATRGIDAGETDANLEYLKEKTKESVRQVLTAGGDEEEVLDGGQFGHSVFTGRLIQKLQEVNDFITAQEIATDISKKVFADAQGRGHKQTPQYGVLEGLGDFVFVPNRQKTLDALGAQEKQLNDEIKQLEALEARSRELQDAEALSKAERERRIKQLELEKAEEAKKQLEDMERKRQEEMERLRLRQYEEAKRSEEQQSKLAEMKAQIQAKQKELVNINMPVDLALAKVKKLTEEKNADITKLTVNRDEAVNRTEMEFNQLIGSIPPKSMFEKKAEYEARVKAKKEQFASERGETVAMLDAQLREAVTEIENAYREPIGKLADTTYLLALDELNFKVEDYDAENEVCPIKLTIKSTIATVPANLKLKLTPAVAQELYSHLKVVLPEVRVSIDKSALTAYVDEIKLIDHSTKAQYPLYSLQEIERQRMLAEQRAREEQERQKREADAAARQKAAEQKRQDAIRRFETKDTHFGFLYRNCSMGTVFGLEYVNTDSNVGYEFYTGTTSLASLNYRDDYKVVEEGRILGARAKLYFSKDAGVYGFFSLEQGNDLKVRDDTTGSEKTLNVRSINMMFLWTIDAGIGFEWHGKEALRNFTASLEISLFNGYLGTRDVFDDAMWGDYDTGASKMAMTWFYYGLSVSWRF